MVFLITQGAPQITNIVALFAHPLDFRGNKAGLNGYTWMRPRRDHNMHLKHIFFCGGGGPMGKNLSKNKNSEAQVKFTGSYKKRV